MQPIPRRRGVTPQLCDFLPHYVWYMLVKYLSHLVQFYEKVWVCIWTFEAICGQEHMSDTASVTAHIFKMQWFPENDRMMLSEACLGNPCADTGHAGVLGTVHKVLDSWDSLGSRMPAAAAVHLSSYLFHTVQLCRPQHTLCWCLRQHWARRWETVLDHTLFSHMLAHLCFPTCPIKHKTLKLQCFHMMLNMASPVSQAGLLKFWGRYLRDGKIAAP